MKIHESSICFVFIKYSLVFIMYLKRIYVYASQQVSNMVNGHDSQDEVGTPLPAHSMVFSVALS